MRTWTALLMLVVAAGHAEEKKEALHLVVARKDSTHVAAQLPLSDTDLREAKFIWAWTGELPPRRFAAQEVPDAERIVEELSREKPRPLLVRVRGWASAEELLQLRVIAAPRDMWGSVPESLLPSFTLSPEGQVAVPARDAVRVRVVGNGVGTMWQQVGASGRSVDLVLRPSSDASIRFRAHDGSNIPRVFATVMTTRQGDAAATLQAQFATDDRGLLRIQALPAEIITLVVSAEGAALQAISGTAQDLSRTVRLAPGGTLKGRFVSEEGDPLEGVGVDAEGWVASPVRALSVKKALSDASGRWTVSGLPLTDIAVRAASKGRATFRKSVSLVEGETDLGTMPLPLAREMTLEVLDAAELPVPNAVVSSDTGFKGKTGKNGLVLVTGLAPEEAVTLTVTASGFVKSVVHLSTPVPERERAVLERAFSVNGRVVDDAGVPVSDAVVIVTIGSRYERENLGDDGTFAIEVEAGRDFDLTFESPSAGTISRKEPAGRPGESRDLGALALPAGLSLRGRIVDSVGVPLAGVRVSVLRPSLGGAVVAWTGGRMVQAVSEVEGAFTLRGLQPGPALLRIDAPDYARAHRQVLVEESLIDLGTIELVRGSTVNIKAAGDDSAIARIDLRGEWLEMDMLTAPMVGGVARVRNVPPGQYGATVLARGVVVCEQQVDVIPDREATVECPAVRTVTGRVLIGGVTARGGALTWTRPGRESAALIETWHSPLGAPQQRLFGGGHGVVAVPVRSDGSFESDQLQPGQWEVVWSSTDGASTPGQPVLVPDLSEPRVDIRFDGAALRGRVVDNEGAPVSGARVREVGGSLVTVASSAGLFTMTGLAAGVRRLQAVQGTRASRIVDVAIEPGRETPEIVLEIGDEEQNVLEVSVVGRDGLPRANAFVFVEAGAVRILTADGNGHARGAFPLGLPDGARIVVYSGNEWAFGALRRTGEEGSLQKTTIRFERTGSLQIESRESSGEPALVSSQVGDIAWMLARVGYALEVRPGAATIIHGLPKGLYEVRLGSAAAVVSVTPGSRANVKLP